MTHARAIAALALFLVTAAPAHGEAQDVEALLEQGVAARRERRDEDALRLFRRAHELSPSPRTLAQVALAEQAIGLWMEARTHLAEALLADDDPWISARRDALTEALVRIRRHLGRLAIAGGVEGAEVRIDGSPSATLPLAEPLWVPAGSIRVEVRAPGREAFAQDIHIVAGEQVSLRVDEQASVRVELAAPDERPIVESTPRIAAGGGGGGDVVAIGGVSLGVAAIALGLGIGFHAARESDAQYFASDACARRDTRRGDACPDTLNAIRSSEVGMGVGYAGAGAFAIAGALLLAVGASSSSPAETTASCGPGPSEISASCAFRF